MSDDPMDDPHGTAIEQLEAFGLSTYAARTFVALVSLGEGTAKDVSRVADVPRTRVYDAVEELHQEGLVDIRESTPRRFHAISAETTGRKFQQRFKHRTSLLGRALEQLEPATVREKQRGVWTITNQESITGRVLELIGSADGEIVFMIVEDLLTDDVVAALSDAADRGVSIYLGGVSAPVQDRLQERIDGIEMYESLWLWSDTPAARLLLADGEKTLVSVRTEVENDEGRSETAIWGAGEDNSLVVVIDAIFAWRLGSDLQT